VGQFSKIPADNRTGAGRTLVSDLLDKAGFGTVLVQKALADGGGVPPALVTDAAKAEGVQVFAAAMPVNAGGLVGRMTKVEAFREKTAAILRPCETKALVELVKLKQARTENLVVLGVDCPGTYPNDEYRDRAGADPEADLEKRLAGEAEGLRGPCLACVDPQAPWADLRVCLYGAEGVGLEAVTDAGAEVLEALGYENAEFPGREGALKAEAEKRAGVRTTMEKEFLGSVQGHKAVVDYFASCLKCHNCRTVCPICYCKECFFDSPTFELEAEKYVGWARARGALRMPADTLLFHLTRLNHMVHSCVACGMCTQGCPEGIDVGLLFSTVGKRVQKLFEYEPGRDPEAEIPLSTFREDELEVFGGK
jgi:formate dehydrogenase subunit beta